MVLTTLLLADIRDNTKTRISTTFTHGAVGTGTTTPTAGDTTLVTEVFRDTIDEVDTSGTDTAVSSLRVLTSEANGNAIAEHGTFNMAAGGSMWTRNTMTAINKTSDIQLFMDTQITITVTET